MSDEVVVDALPYIDQGYDEPGVRDAALQMVEEETRRFRPTKNYLEHLPALKLNAFETDIMRHEFERIQQRLPMEVLSMKRYELPTPPPGRIGDLTAWTECVDNSSAQLQHQSERIHNLELLHDYGTETWRANVEILLKDVNIEQNRLQDMRKQIQEVNWSRKKSQLQVGEKLKESDTKWVSLVGKNYEIKQAIAELERQVYERKLIKQRYNR
ncbi:pre-mRNA-splicing factor SPF27 [Planococcus citri]|uniref:pre-mRNA-splicing factor SPF27 n=1 Tax=Planococcus citri TaxID=170843 RepID=UPI0031F97970